MWASVIAVAEEIKAGRFEVLESGTPGASLNGVFGGFGPM